MAAIVEEHDSLWRPSEAASQLGVFRKCRNYWQYNVCNWLVPEESGEEFCLSCRLNRTIPNLWDQGNVVLWARMETAKRRLLYSLLRLRLPLRSWLDDSQQGLAFDFLSENATGPTPGGKVVTGHEDGVITINLAEADDVIREQNRSRLGERYRTLLGHFRHEIGHYYWQALVNTAFELERFRATFGDERVDYGESLQRHYDGGPPENWQENYITPYASAHPWEDWAESWAHYLHMVDTTETAGNFGISVQDLPQVQQPLPKELAVDDPVLQGFRKLIDDWVPVTIAINSINRSMGVDDLYPFVVTSNVAAKLAFVHQAVVRAGDNNG